MQITKLAHEKLLAAIDFHKQDAEAARAEGKKRTGEVQIKLDLLHEARARDKMTEMSVLRNWAKGA